VQEHVPLLHVPYAPQLTLAHGFVVTQLALRTPDEVVLHWANWEEHKALQLPLQLGLFT
jgi:hypothetical protein